MEISTIRMRVHCIRTNLICKIFPNENLRKLQICIAFSIIWQLLYLLLPESKQLFLTDLLLFEYLQNLFKIHTCSHDNERYKQE